MTLQQRWRVGVDIGGTFTDFVLYDGDERAVDAAQAPDHAARSVRGGAGRPRRAGRAPAASRSPTSARSCTARRSSPTPSSSARARGSGLITTRGFRDVLEMGTEQRYDIYDLFLDLSRAARRRATSASRSTSGSTATARVVDAARRGGGRRAARRAGRGRAARRSRSASCTPTATPRTSARAAAHPPRGVPGVSRLALVRGRRRDLGVPALRHHLRQRLSSSR